MIFRILTLATISFLSAEGAALADPPARVGRLSYTEGTVSSHTADQQDWAAAELNYPVTTGSSFWTEPNSRSELEAGDMELRMDQSTEVDVTRLDDEGTVITVPQGAINLHVNSLPEGGVQIETPGGEVDIGKPGSYHIDAGQVDPNNPDSPPPTTQIMVLEGEAKITTPTTDSIIKAGENALVGTNPPSLIVQQGRPTPFDNWALSREKNEVARQTPQYVSPETTGYEDLDSQGQWQSTPEYGQVWYPTTVVADWAPYRYGHWAFVAPWGWTWIDAAPWGFAPFHYGRWVHYHNHWGWTPGERIRRPVYAPALVAFVGGNNFNVTLSGGRRGPGVGWVPLAPHEVFHPYYHTSNDYARNVNRSNVNRTVINNITVNNTHNTTVNHYANAQNTTVVSSDTFAHGRPVHNETIHVPHNQLNQATVAPQVTHIAPTPEARHGGAIAKDTPAPTQHNYHLSQTRGDQHPHNQPEVAPEVIRPTTDVRRIPTDVPPKALGERRAAPSAPVIIRGNQSVAPREQNTIRDIKPEVSQPTEPTVIRPETRSYPGPVNRHQSRLEPIHPTVTAPQQPETPQVESHPANHEAQHHEQRVQTPNHAAGQQKQQTEAPREQKRDETAPQKAVDPAPFAAFPQGDRRHH